MNSEKQIDELEQTANQMSAPYPLTIKNGFDDSILSYPS
jgi:hypothetical protein